MKFHIDENINTIYKSIKTRQVEKLPEDTVSYNETFFLDKISGILYAQISSQPMIYGIVYRKECYKKACLEYPSVEIFNDHNTFNPIRVQLL